MRNNKCRTSANGHFIANWRSTTASFSEKAFGVVPFARGFGVRMKTNDFQQILTQIQPENNQHFSGK